MRGFGWAWRVLIAVLLAVAVVCVSSAAASSRVYTAQAIGAVGSATAVFGVSDTGVVVGYADNGTGPRAIEWQNGTVTTLPEVAGTKRSFAYAVSPNGEWIVGDDFAPRSVPVVWHDGAVTVLPSLTGSATPSGVNDFGVVVGRSNTPRCVDEGYCPHAVYWGRLHVIHDLGTLPGNRFSGANAINDDGVIVGVSSSRSGVTRPAVWRHRRIHELPTLGHVGDTSRDDAVDINSTGTICGIVKATRRHWHAVIWRDHRIHDLGAPRHASSFCSQINDNGAIIGVAYRNDTSHAIRWTPAHILEHLTALVITPGWRLHTGDAINNHGWLAGTGDLNGTERAYLLRPTTR